MAFILTLKMSLPQQPKDKRKWPVASTAQLHLLLPIFSVSLKAMFFISGTNSLLEITKFDIILFLNNQKLITLFYIKQVLLDTQQTLLQGVPFYFFILQEAGRGKVRDPTSEFEGVHLT